MVVAHFAHGLRPWADRREQALVRRTAADLGLPFEAGQGRTKPSEAAAREERYRSPWPNRGEVRRCGRPHRSHAGRSGGNGAAAPDARRRSARGRGDTRAVEPDCGRSGADASPRPYWPWNRVETEAVCKEAGVSPARDASNRSLKYARNRVRLRVLRELGELNPDVRAALARVRRESR